MTFQLPNMFTFFVSLNPLGIPVKEAEIGLMIINFQEEEIASYRAETTCSSFHHKSGGRARILTTYSVS